MAAVPAVDPARRNARVGPTRLPAAGRAGDPPAWPLDDGPSVPERGAWERLWATPQAVMWQRLGYTRVVARYVRVLIGAEQLNKDCMSEARQLEDRLGLTPKAMRMLLWEIAVDEVAEKRDEKQAETAAKSARERFKAVG